MTISDYAAWYGAIIATVVLIFEIFKWKMDGPKIAVSYKKNVTFPDSKIISETITDNGKTQELEVYFMVEVINRGNMPTTLHNIELNADIGFAIKFSSSSAFIPHFGQAIPRVINQGEMWSCRLPMKYVDQGNNVRRKYLNIYFSHLEKPIVIEIDE